MLLFVFDTKTAARDDVPAAVLKKKENEQTITTDRMGVI